MMLPNNSTMSSLKVLLLCACIIGLNWIIASNSVFEQTDLKLFNNEEPNTQQKQNDLHIIHSLVIQPQSLASTNVSTPSVWTNSITPAPSTAITGCGQICQNDIPGHPSKFFDFIKKTFDCESLWQNKEIDESRIGPPTALQEIPPDMLNDFTYNARVPITPYVPLLDQAYLGSVADTPVWHKEQIDTWAVQCAQGTLEGNYGKQETARLWQGLKHVPEMAHAKVLVIGSENPWVEACILSAGAAHVTTLEYGKIVSHHPMISTITPAEMREQFSRLYQTFDVIVSFSSVEHAGLGRYGDKLNPWGDRQAIARAWCATKPGGYLVLGVPYGNDMIEYNAHRVYGKIMYPHLVANWYQQWRDDYEGGHRVHVFRKSLDGENDPEYNSNQEHASWVGVHLPGQLGNNLFSVASSYGIARSRVRYGILVHMFVYILTLLRTGCQMVCSWTGRKYFGTGSEIYGACTRMSVQRNLSK